MLAAEGVIVLCLVALPGTVFEETLSQVVPLEALELWTPAKVVSLAPF